MVSSQLFNHCEGNSSSESASESFNCPTKLCDCVQIVGHDHLKSKRARKFRCKNKRIRQLAEPKSFNQKYCEEVLRNTKTAVEIVRPSEEHLPMRIKMLSYPKVRKLISSRDTYKSLVERERFENLIRRSMLTMYSRLANVHPPCDPTKQKKWTKADWERHCEWLKKRAMPKMLKNPPPAKSGKKVPLQQLLMSMYALSRPRHPSQKYRPRCGYVSTVKASAQVYTPSERVLQLAVPKVKDADGEDDSDPFQIKPEALKAKPCKMTSREKILWLLLFLPQQNEFYDWRRRKLFQKCRRKLS